MQSKQTPARRSGHDDWDGAAWDDERQVAVWGQVSARTLNLVVMLNAVAGLIFYSIDSTRYGPCVAVSVAIAVGSSAYASWMARRKGVDVRLRRPAGLPVLVAQSVVFGVLFYVVERFTAGGHNHDSWPTAVLTIALCAVGFGFGMRFLTAWQRRRALCSQEATDDDVLDAPGPMR
jgi:Kef-type K+ transport system membrane component KefB